MTAPRLAVLEPVGPEDAPVLLLGPSLGTSTRLWADAAADLRRDHRVIAWDLPGHGRSPAAEAPFAIEDLADALAAMLDDLGVDACHYAGDSIGGAVGLALMLRRPERVRSAALLCTGAKIGTAESWAERAATVRSTGTASLVVPSAQRWFAPGSIEREPEACGELLNALRDADDESYAKCCEALAAFDARERLGEIDRPVLAVWGTHDAVTGEASLREIAEGVRRGRLVEVEDAAHLVPAEQPARTAALLREHVAGAAR